MTYFILLQMLQYKCYRYTSKCCNTTTTVHQQMLRYNYYGTQAHGARQLTYCPSKQMVQCNYEQLQYLWANVTPAFQYLVLLRLQFLANVVRREMRLGSDMGRK